MSGPGGSTVEFRLLGPVEVWAAGRPVDTGRPGQRRVLAALLLDAGRLVTVDTLVDRVWGEQPPSSVRSTLYGHVTRIRRVLGVAVDAERLRGDRQPRLLRRSGGYLLDVPADLVDLHRFRRNADRARDPGRPDRERLALLREAIALWRGEPLAGLPGAWADRVRDGWRQAYLATVVAWAGTESRVGNPDAVIAPLTELAGEYPLVEPLVEALMQALHAFGHPAAALDCYARLRRRLRDDLGIEPGIALRQTQLRILHASP